MSSSRRLPSWPRRRASRGSRSSGLSASTASRSSAPAWRKRSSPPASAASRASWSPPAEVVPEGDTIHRAAARINTALAGREIGLAEAPNPRSPLHRRATELRGRTLEEAEGRGKHLLVHFSDGVVLHTHLGMNGKVFVAADGRLPYGRPWWTLASGRAVAAQTGAKLLRLTSEARVRNDPALMQLGPDPLRPEYDRPTAVARLRDRAAGREIGDALLDQGIVSGIG